MKRIGWIALVVVAGLHCGWAQTVCDVHAYGAKGDGTTKDTAAIQKAIDDCSAKKGTVKLAGGDFVSGPLDIKSNVTLDVEKDAKLLASTDREDFKPATLMRLPSIQPFIRVNNAENVTINGGGLIDGRGQVWWDYVKGVKDSGVLGTDHPRPMGMLIDHSKHFTMENVTFQNAGFWQVVPYYSDYLTFRNIRILAPQRGAPNTDGLDPLSSSHITIDHYFASVGDDNIAIKSGPINSPGPDSPSDGYYDYRLPVRGWAWALDRERTRGRRAAYSCGAHQLQGNGPGDSGEGESRPRQRCVGFDLQGHHDGRCEDVDSDQRVLPEGDAGGRGCGGAGAAAYAALPRHPDREREVDQWRQAGVIVGLPESPVMDIELKNVDIQAKKGLQIGYATVKMENVVVKADDGKGIVMGPKGTVVAK